VPYKKPEQSDPLMLVQINAPGSSDEIRTMAMSFADELAQLGYSRQKILNMFQDPFYKAVHMAWDALGSETIHKIVDESTAFWGRCQVRVDENIAQSSTDTV